MLLGDVNVILDYIDRMLNNISRRKSKPLTLSYAIR